MTDKELPEQCARMQYVDNELRESWAVREAHLTPEERSELVDTRTESSYMVSDYLLICNCILRQGDERKAQLEAYYTAHLKLTRPHE